MSLTPCEQKLLIDLTNQTIKRFKSTLAIIADGLEHIEDDPNAPEKRKALIGEIRAFAVSELPEMFRHD